MHKVQRHHGCGPVTMNEAKEAITEFEAMRNMAELRALSQSSLQSPLSQSQYERMMELKELVFGVGT